MKQIQKINILCVFAILFAAVPDVRSASSLLWQPRIGDAVRVDILDCNPEFTSSAKTINLVSASVTRTCEMKIWEPAPDDTTATFYRTFDNEFESIVNNDGNCVCLYRRTPGYMRRFPQGLPWGMPENIHACSPVSSIGHADNITDYHSRGTLKTTVSGGITFVGADGDTVANSECVEYYAVDTVYYSSTNINLHHGIERQFYGPGYRYPLLVCSNDTIFDSDGLVVDVSENYYSINPKVQEEDIEDDIVNEEIRRIVAEESLYPDNPGHDSHSFNEKNPFPSFITWNSGHNKLIVSNVLGMNGTAEILLCDIQGRVYHSGAVSASSDSYEMDLSICPPGYYLLYVGSDESPYLYRFRL